MQFFLCAEEPKFCRRLWNCITKVVDVDISTKIDLTLWFLEETFNEHVLATDLQLLACCA